MSENNNWLGLDGKVVAITGAAGGMGQKISEEFAKQGSKLVLLDLNGEGIKQLADELNSNYDCDATPIQVNTTDEEKVDAAVKETMDHFGRIDVVVNTAAILPSVWLEDVSLEEWQNALNINLTGYFLVSQHFGREMIKQNKGTLVHISTVAANIPETYSGAYSVSKAGVNMMSRQMSAEWGQFGVRSNCVMPCFIKTPLSADFYKDPEVEEGRKRLLANRTIGETSDVANAVLYLASDRSRMTTGHELAIDGGYSIMMGDMTPRPGGRRDYAKKQHDAFLAKKAKK